MGRWGGEGLHEQSERGLGTMHRVFKQGLPPLLPRREGQKSTTRRVGSKRGAVVGSTTTQTHRRLLSLGPKVDPTLSETRETVVGKGPPRQRTNHG